MDISTQTLPLAWSLLKSPPLSLCPDPLVITVLGATACLPSYPHSEKLSGQGWDRAFHDVVLVLAQCLARSSCPPSECGRETLLNTYWVRRLHFCAHTYQGAEHLRMPFLCISAIWDQILLSWLFGRQESLMAATSYLSIWQEIFHFTSCKYVCF